MFMRVILPLLQSQVPDLERSLANAKRDDAAACLPLGLSARVIGDYCSHAVIGDFFASRDVFGLSMSTLIKGIPFIGLFLLGKEPSTGRVPVASNP
jgi:hypothetical protein